jgi:Arc/MetJ-type ribon-helix-helix transcriptional regulator
LDNINAETLNEEISKDINEKIESGEYINETDLVEKSVLAGDQITQELIQKHLKDVDKYDGKSGVFMKLKQNKVFKVASKVVLAYMLFFKGYDVFAGNET